MKKFAFGLLVLLTANIVHATPVVVEAPVDHLFVPKGFDNNDTIEVVATGKFPTTCYARHKVEVAVKGQVIDVKVTSLLTNRLINTCERMEVPFTENITIGTLPTGAYTIVVNGKVKEPIQIANHTGNAIDEYIYAQVDYVELGFTGGLSGDALLIGKNMEDCLKLDHVEYISNGKDVVSILPIMKKVASQCSGRRTFFEIPVKFKVNEFMGDKVLLFVRTMDGKSVSSMVEKD